LRRAKEIRSTSGSWGMTAKMLRRVRLLCSTGANASCSLVLLGSLLIGFFALTIRRFHSYSLVWDDWRLLNDWSLNSTVESFAGHPLANAGFYYRPVGELLYSLSNRLIGDSVQWQYCLSILILLVVGLILYQTLTLFKANWWLALAIVTVFLVSPFAAYQYSWIANRFELYYITFWALSYYLFLLVFLGKARSPALIVLSLVSFGLSLMCKEQAITLPFVVLLTIVIYGSKDRVVSLRAEKSHILLVLPYFILLGAYLVVVRGLLLGNVWGGESAYSGGTIIVQAAAIAGQYTKAVVYSFLPLTMFFSVGTLLGWMALLLVNICLFWGLVIRRGIGREQKKHVLFLLSFILILSVPLAKSPSARMLLMHSIPLSVLIGCNLYCLASEYHTRLRIAAYLLTISLLVGLMFFSIGVQERFHPGTKWVIENNASRYCGADLSDAMRARMQRLYFDRYPQYVVLVCGGQMLEFPRYAYDGMENYGVDDFIIERLRGRGLLE
jgi:hypothetical protein